MPATTAKSSVAIDLKASFILLAFIASGCSSSSSFPVALSDLSVPEELQWDGRTWQRESLSPQDQQLLERYFRQHPELADNPLWHRNLANDYGAFENNHGLGASPTQNEEYVY